MNWASSTVFTSHQKAKAKSWGHFRFLRLALTVIPDPKLPQASWLKMKAFSSGSPWLQFPGQSCKPSQSMDHSHHTASEGAGSSGRRRLYLPGSEAKSRRREAARTCPEKTGGEWEKCLIKLEPEAAGMGKRRHGM